MNVVYKYKNILSKLNEIKEKLINKTKVLKEVSSDGDTSDYKDDEDDKIDENNGKKMRIVWYNVDNLWIWILWIETVFFLMYFVDVKIYCLKIVSINFTYFIYLYGSTVCMTGILHELSLHSKIIQAMSLFWTYFQINIQGY